MPKKKVSAPPRQSTGRNSKASYRYLPVTGSGIESDPFESDVASQVLKRKDSCVFSMDTTATNTRSVLTKSADDGGIAHRLLWKTPLVYSANVAATTMVGDSRGLVTEVYGGQVFFRNLTDQPLDVKINTPKSHILGGSIFKANTRDGDTELHIPPHSEKKYRYSFAQSSNSLQPYYNKVAFPKKPTEQVAPYTPVMVLADFAVIIPDINLDTGAKFVAGAELLEVAVHVHYAASAAMATGASLSTGVSSIVLNKLPSIASIYAVDAVLQPSNPGVGAGCHPVGFKWVVADPRGHTSIGYRTIPEVEPDTRSGDVYNVQLVTYGSGGVHPLQISECESERHTLVTPFSVLGRTLAHKTDYMQSMWKWDRLTCSFLLYECDNLYRTKQRIDEDLPFWPDDVPLLTYTSDRHDNATSVEKGFEIVCARPNVYLDPGTIVLIAECAMAILSVLKSHMRKNNQ